MGQSSSKKANIKEEYYSLIKSNQIIVYNKYKNQELSKSVKEVAQGIEQPTASWRDVLSMQLNQNRAKQNWAPKLDRFIKSDPFIIETKWRDHIFFTSFSQSIIGMNPNPLLISSMYPLVSIGATNFRLNEFESLLQRQLWNAYNPFNQIIRKFCMIFVKDHASVFNVTNEFSMISDTEIAEIAKKGSFSPPANYNKDLSSSNESVIVFSHMLIKAIKVYYNQSLDQKKIIKGLQDTLYNTILQDILSGKTYEIFKILYEKQYEKHQTILKHKLQEMAKAEAKDIISNKYHSFYPPEYIYELIEKKAVNAGKKMSDLYTAKYLQHVSQVISSPYIYFIKKIKEFEQAKSVKIKCAILSKFKKELEDYVMSFWKPIGVSDQNIAVSAESILQILQYIIIKSQCYSLFGDIAIIFDYFSQIAGGEVKYTINMFQCALTVLIDIAYENHPLKLIMQSPRSVKQSLLVFSDDEDN